MNYSYAVTLAVHEGAHADKHAFDPQTDLWNSVTILNQKGLMLYFSHSVF